MDNKQAVKAASQRRQCWPKQPDDPGGVVFLTDLHLIRFRKQRDNIFAVLSEEYRVVVDGQTITVPAAYETDLASVPRRLRGIVSIDRGIEAAVVHDWLYSTRTGTRKSADLIFKRLLEASEGWATVQAMYLAVRVGGRFNW